MDFTSELRASDQCRSRGEEKRSILQVSYHHLCYRFMGEKKIKEWFLFKARSTPRILLYVIMYSTHRLLLAGLGLSSPTKSMAYPQDINARSAGVQLLAPILIEGAAVLVCMLQLLQCLHVFLLVFAVAVLLVVVIKGNETLLQYLVLPLLKVQQL